MKTSSSVVPAVVVPSSDDSAVPASILKYPHQMLPLIVVNGANGNHEARIDSRIIANELGVKPTNTRELIDQYLPDFEEFGKVRLETEASGKTNQLQKFYLLNENQACLLLTYVQNTDQARTLKKNLIHAFAYHRDNMQLRHQGGWIPIPLGCTTRPLIQSRAQLSFRTTDEAGNAVMALTDCRAAWDVPRGLSINKARQIGKKYFTELQELAHHNPQEAQDALIELFLFGWRTPMQIKQPKATEKVGMGDGQQVTVLKKDAWVNPDVVRDYEVEWSFLTALAGVALGGAN